MISAAVEVLSVNAMMRGRVNVILSEIYKLRNELDLMAESTWFDLPGKQVELSLAAAPMHNLAEWMDAQHVALSEFICEAPERERGCQNSGANKPCHIQTPRSGGGLADEVRRPR